jgi:hypothetical protein
MIDADLIRERWAYSELLSDTQGNNYQRVGPQGIAALIDKARQRFLFDQLDQAERTLLRQAWEAVRGGPCSIFNLYFADDTQFQLVPLTRRDLARLLVIPYFVQDVDFPQRFARKLTFEHWIAGPVTSPAPSHARNAASGPVPASMNDDPITVGRRPPDGELILIDGYHRAVRFWTGNDQGTLSAYVSADVLNGGSAEVRHAHSSGYQRRHSFNVYSWIRRQRRTGPLGRSTL